MSNTINREKTVTKHGGDLNVNEDDGSLRVLRGGSWYNVAYDYRSADRYVSDADVRYIGIGFRVCSSLA